MTSIKVDAVGTRWDASCQKFNGKYRPELHEVKDAKATGTRLMKAHRTIELIAVLHASIRTATKSLTCRGPSSVGLHSRQQQGAITL